MAEPDSAAEAGLNDNSVGRDETVIECTVHNPRNVAHDEEIPQMSTATTTLTGTYTIDPTHSRIGFVARHAMVTKVRGSFNEFQGSGHFDAEDPANSHLALTIEAASIDTRNTDRDGHLQGNDFFDMETYPKITFVSTAVEQVDAQNYRVTGDLTIKGVTNPVTVDFEYTGTAIDPYQNQRIGFEGQHHRQPQGLGHHLERRPRQWRRPRQREGRPRVRGLRYPHGSQLNPVGGQNRWSPQLLRRALACRPEATMLSWRN